MAWGQTMVGVMIVMATVSLTSTGFKQYMNWEFPDVQVDLEKAEEPEIKLPTSIGSENPREFQKNIDFCFIDYTKAFDCVDHNKL